MTGEISKVAAIPPALADEYSELSGLDVAQLREELTKSLHLSAAYLRRLAVIVRLLEERGEDLSHLQIRLLPFLRQIAYGQVLPEIVIRYGDSPGLTRMVGRLPLPDQARIAAGEGVPLVVRRGDEFDHRLVDPSMLSVQQFHQVFGRGGIRPIEEQIVLLEARPEKEKRSTRGAPRADRRRDGVVVGTKFIPRTDLLSLLAELSDAGEAHGDDEDLEKAVPVKLTRLEHLKLKDRSNREDVSMANLIRRAMKRDGLI